MSQKILEMINKNIHRYSETTSKNWSRAFLIRSHLRKYRAKKLENRTDGRRKKNLLSEIQNIISMRMVELKKSDKIDQYIYIFPPCPRIARMRKTALPAEDFKWVPISESKGCKNSKLRQPDWKEISFSDISKSVLTF